MLCTHIDGNKHMIFSSIVLCYVDTISGQVVNAEVRKPKYRNGTMHGNKYGSEKKSRLSVSSALVTHNCAL